MLSIMRFNGVDPDGTGERWAERYRAFLDMAVHAEAHGLFGCSLEEHHGVANGWSPTPMLTAGMLAARTSTLSISISALLLPLHEPIRVAEDLAVLDLVSGGRVSVIFGLGYRPDEYTLMGQSWDDRGARMDECLDTVIAAWTGEPFEYRGEMVQIAPVPKSTPHPIVMIGGTSKPAARRAARNGLPLFPAKHLPELETYYYDKCTEYGTNGFYMAPSEDTAMVFPTEDPDRVWAELGHHFLYEAQTYRSWQQPGQQSAVKSSATTVEELRAEGIYRALTPHECRDAAAGGSIAIHPLVGGMPIDEAWTAVQLFADQVLPGPA